MIHPTAEVQTEKIGTGTQVWQYSIILEDAIIGKNCNINCHVFIENDVNIGNNVTIKPGVQIWDGLRIEDDVFIGPNVTFVNDKRPRSKQYPDSFQKTTIKKSASIGAGSVILGGITVEAFAMVGAGTLVTELIPERALVIGNPGRIVGWLNKDGTKMEKKGNNTWVDSDRNKWKRIGDRIKKV